MCAVFPSSGDVKLNAVRLAPTAFLWKLACIFRMVSHIFLVKVKNNETLPNYRSP